MRRLILAALVSLLAAGPALAQTSYFNGQNYGNIGGRIPPHVQVLVPNGIDTQQVQAAINRSGTQAFILGPGTFTVCGLTINTGETLEGAGRGVTTLKQSTGCAHPVLSSFGFSGLTGTGSAGGVYNFAIGGFKIVGNNTAGDGIDIYGYQYEIHDLFITLVAGNALWTEYDLTGVTPHDCHVDHLTVDTVGKIGWYSACSDTHCEDLNIHGASQSATNTYDAIETTGAIHCSNINVWGILYTGPTHRYSLNLGNNGSTVDNVHLELGETANLYIHGNLDHITNMQAYNLPDIGTPVGFILAGNENLVEGFIGAQAGTTSAVGVQFGTSLANAPQANILILIVDGYTDGLFDFTYDGGYNYLVGTNYLTSGTNVIGTPSATDAIRTVGDGGHQYDKSQ